MRIKIDEALCVGHGVCYMYAPLILEPDERGYGQVRDEDSDIAEEHLNSARKAALSCPENAITLVD